MKVPHHLLLWQMVMVSLMVVKDHFLFKHTFLDKENGSIFRGNVFGDWKTGK